MDDPEEISLEDSEELSLEDDLEKTSSEDRKRLIGIELISRVTDCFDKIKKKYLKSVGQGFIEIEFIDILENDIELAENVLDFFSEAYHAFTSVANHIFEDTAVRINKTIEVRFVNLPQTNQIYLYQIRSHLLDKLVTFQGVIRSSSEIMTRIKSTRLECPACGNQLTVLQDLRSIKYPKCGCGGRLSRVVFKDTIDMQICEIEELPEKMESIQQTMQRSKILIEGSMTDPTFSAKLQPGNRVEIVGALIEKPFFLLPKDEQKGTTLITYIIKAVSIQILEMEYSDIELSKEDIKLIEETSKDPALFEKLRKSIAPGLFGLEKIKQVLLLQAVEGVEKMVGEELSRGKIHVLLVGDPSTGKSRLLETLFKLAPKARYATGGSTTRAGLTSAAVRDEVSGQWVLEAGALVLAHQGLLCLDEADKMSSDDIASFHEAMAQGTISKVVAGISARLQSNTTVLASANPKLARFDPVEHPFSQIDLPPTFLSRFDVIYPLLDTIGEKDRKLAEFILSSHREPKKIEPPFKKEFIRKYLAYAKRFSPKLTIEAEKILVDYFVDLREDIMSVDSESRTIPIATRQLHALRRLSEASAKIRLDNYVRVQDAKRAKSIFIDYMSKFGVDPETGKFDVDKITSAVAASDRLVTKRIRNILYELSEEYTNIDDVLIIEKGLKRGMSAEQIDKALELLDRQGEIFSPKAGQWQLLK